MEHGLDAINESQLGFSSLYCKTSGLETWVILNQQVNQIQNL